MLMTGFRAELDNFLSALCMEVTVERVTVSFLTSALRMFAQSFVGNADFVLVVMGTQIVLGKYFAYCPFNIWQRFRLFLGFWS